MGPVLPYLKDETVTEILINGPQNIYIERKGKLEKVNASFNDEDASGLWFTISVKVCGVASP